MTRTGHPFDAPLPGLHFGGHLAEVISLDDPENLSRVQVRLLSFDGVDGHDGPVWARVSAPFAGGDRGAFWLPDVGDEVLVTFLSGDPRFPIILGGLWNGQSPPPANIQSGGRNRYKVVKSRNGITITLDDQDGAERCILETPGGQKITLKDGGAEIRLEDSTGNSIKMESAGITVRSSSKITLDAPSIAIKAATVNADTAMAKFTGVVKSEAVTTSAVISKSYTPGAGNIW